MLPSFIFRVWFNFLCRLHYRPSRVSVSAFQWSECLGISSSSIPKHPPHDIDLASNPSTSFPTPNNQQHVWPTCHHWSHLPHRHRSRHIHWLLSCRLERNSRPEPTLASSCQIPQWSNHVVRSDLGHLDPLLYLAGYTSAQRFVEDRGYLGQSVLCLRAQCDSISGDSGSRSRVWGRLSSILVVHGLYGTAMAGVCAWVGEVEMIDDIRTFLSDPPMSRS